MSHSVRRSPIFSSFLTMHDTLLQRLQTSCGLNCMVVDWFNVKAIPSLSCFRRKLKLTLFQTSFSVSSLSLFMPVSVCLYAISTFVQCPFNSFCCLGVCKCCQRFYIDNSTITITTMTVRLTPWVKQLRVPSITSRNDGNSFTVRLSTKFAKQWSLNIPRHLKCDPALPCQILSWGWYRPICVRTRKTSHSHVGLKCYTKCDLVAIIGRSSVWGSA